MIDVQHVIDHPGMDDATLLGSTAELRLPVSQAAALIIAMSLGVWGIIGLGLRLIVV
jgi:hypothetical protein